VRRGFAPPQLSHQNKGLCPSYGLRPFTSIRVVSSLPSVLYLTKRRNLMAHRFLISHDSPVLFITIVTQHRLRVFQTDKMRELLCSAIDEARRSAHFFIFAYVIMLDHMHLLTSRPSATSDLLRVLKGLTARRIIDYLKTSGYDTSLAKLRHQSKTGSTSIHCGRPNAVFCQFSVRGC
jgi:REP element-mobilizing transposase RayT